MAVFLLKIIFLALSSIIYLVSRLIFNGAAHLLVLAIQAFKVPGQAINSGLEHVANLIKVFFEYFFEFLKEAIVFFISTCIDILKEAVSGSVGLTSSAIGELMGKMKTALDGLSKDFPEVFEGLSEMIWTMVVDLWNNYKDAIGYVRENA